MSNNRNLKEIVYQSILDGIIKDEYKAGQIINEKELSERFSVSKSPVREALTALCSENVLKNIPRYGYEVIKITRRNVADILEFRAILETGCMQSCYKNLLPIHFQRLEQINKKCITIEESDNAWTHWSRNREFHLQLIAYSNNTYAYDCLKKAMDVLKRAYAQFYLDRWDEEIGVSDVKSHEPIINCLKEGDIESAKIHLKNDLMDFGY